jgi:signal transduction histidine kinase
LPERVSRLASWTPALVFGGLSLVCAIFAWQLNVHLRVERLQPLALNAGQVKGQLAACVDGRLGLLEHEAETFVLGPRDRATFESVSRALQARFGGFQALSWMTREGVITWVVPLEGNEAAVGLDIAKHATAGGAWRAARDRDRLSVTAPIQLAQGGVGFATYMALRREGQLVGFLNGVFRAPELVRTCLGEPLPGLGYELSQGGRVLARWGVPDAAHGLRVVERFQVRDATWTLSVWGDERAHVHDAFTHFLPVILGFGLSVLITGVVRWAMKRQLRVVEGQARFRALVDQAPEAIAVLDLDARRVVDVNPRARRQLGVEAERIAERLWGDGGLPTERMAAAATGTAQIFEHDFGDAGVFEVRLSRLPSAEGRWLRVSLLDIGERLRAEAERGRLMDALEDQTTQLQGILYAVAHDLRTPLVSIGGYAGMAAQGDAPQREESLAAIEHQVARLDAMLVGLHRLAAVGQRAVLKSSLSLEDELATISATLSAEEGARLSILGELPDLESDASMLGLALHEAIHNALRHGGGPVRISAGRRGSWVALRVSDSGRGMTPWELEHAFEVFRRFDGAGAGEGLGLAILHRAVSRLGGRVRITAAAGEGTSVIIELPG